MEQQQIIYDDLSNEKNNFMIKFEKLNQKI